MIDVALLGIIRRWHLRDKVPLREIAKRLGISRNTVRRYLRSETTEPAYAERQSAMTDANNTSSPKIKIPPIALFMILFIPAFALVIWLKSYLHADSVDISQLTRPHVGWNCKEWIDGSRSNRMVGYRFYPASDGYPTFQWWITEGEGSAANSGGATLLFLGGYKLTGSHIRFVTAKNEAINSAERVFDIVKPLDHYSTEDGEITRLTSDSLHMTLMRNDSKFKFECSSVVHDDSVP